MVTWMSLITVGTIIVFVIVYKRLNRNSGDEDEKDIFDDAESIISGPVSKTSIVDILDGMYDPRYSSQVYDDIKT